MSQIADLLGRIVLKEGEDRRTRTFTVSSRTVTAFVWHQFQVNTTSPVQVNLGGAAASTGTKALYLESDKRVYLGFASGQTCNDVPANGFHLSMLTNTTQVWLKMLDTTTATVQVALFQF